MFECAYLVDPGIGTKGVALMLEEIAVLKILIYLIKINSLNYSKNVSQFCK